MHLLLKLFANKVRNPMGYVIYYGTPPNDERFRFPNLPSFNFAGVTGWDDAAAPGTSRTGSWNITASNVTNGGNRCAEQAKLFTASRAGNF